jgi:propanol-preferring alcohol dehydrogenase
MDLVVFNELRLVGSLGCPIATYTGMLSMVAAGKLQPTRLVEASVSVDKAGPLLSDMTLYNTLGFSVISDWTGGATTGPRSALQEATA